MEVSYAVLINAWTEKRVQYCWDAAREKHVSVESFILVNAYVLLPAFKSFLVLLLRLSEQDLLELLAQWSSTLGVGSYTNQHHPKQMPVQQFCRRTSEDTSLPADLGLPSTASLVLSTRELVEPVLQAEWKNLFEIVVWGLGLLLVGESSDGNTGKNGLSGWLVGEDESGWAMADCRNGLGSQFRSGMRMLGMTSAYLLGGVELTGQLVFTKIVNEDTHLLEQLGKLLVDSQVHHWSVLDSVS